MEVDGVMPQRQLQIIRPGRTNGTDLPHALHTLIDPQHPGDAAFRQHLIEDVGLGLSLLRQGLEQFITQVR